MTLTISGVQIGGDNPCRFVAELSNNHNGDFQRALRLIDAAKAAGADFVKFQCYTPDELVELRGDGPASEPWGSQGWTMRMLYEAARTPHDWFPRLVQHCESVGIPWFSSVFGGESLNLLESLGCPAYKIARLDNQSDGLWMRVFGTGKPLLMSFGPRDRVNFNATLRLWCPEGYPQTKFTLGWPFAKGCDIAYDSPVEVEPDYQGFSFHGTDPRPCVVAGALGAKLIEAHFHLAEEPSELESNVSLDQYVFARMVSDVRATEAMLG